MFLRLDQDFHCLPRQIHSLLSMVIGKRWEGDALSFLLMRFHTFLHMSFDILVPTGLL